MNICPRCEVEMEKGLELCPDCAGEEAGAPVHANDACLELEDGRRLELVHESTLLGRRDPLEAIDPDVDLGINGGYEQGVSRRHAVIYRDGDRYSLEDLGSKNGTILNREKVPPGEPVELSEGDVIYLGNLKAVFHAGFEEGSVS
ncbi:MAG: FHA domain-containing protein [bacterium]|nr:MAG: FHA domain-containing protein [bacterium]